MAEEMKNQTKKTGRPKNPERDLAVDEQNQERLDMSGVNNKDQKFVTIDELTNRWKSTFQSMVKLDGVSGISTISTQWSKLNPFLQNQRLKNLYTNAQKYDKVNIGEFLTNPAAHERELRGLGWANASSQQIYYNILRRSCDIPLYNYFVIPDLFDESSAYDKNDFKNEDRLVQDWLECFNIRDTFKTIALEVKREGKSSYLLRNKFVGEGKSKTTGFCTLQKLPTDYVKITGKGQLGYTISFNMSYFLNISNSPADYGEFFVKAYDDLIEKGIIDQETKKLDIDKAKNYSFTFGQNSYSSSLELTRSGRQTNYMFWLRLPYDIVYTFGSDNSNPWVAPDTMGLMLKLQELTDYGQLAGLIASTPLTAVLTGEIETIANARAGKNESVYSPEVIKGYMDQFNAATSTNIEAWLWPAKNVKLQQLDPDVHSSEMISTATCNFLESAGEAGLTIATEKPNVAQITVSRQLAAAQQDYVTIQFEKVTNFILKHKLGFKYNWKLRIWGDIFNIDNERKFLKEVVANGNIALLPKLMSAENISMRDTKALTEYIKQFDFYKDFLTYTQLKNSELAQKASKEQNDQKEDEKEGAGRPSLSDGEIQNENTEQSRAQGTNTSDNREQLK